MRTPILVFTILTFACLNQVPRVAAQSNTAQGYYDQGKRHLEANRCAEAVDAFKRAIAILPGSPPYNALGRAYDCLNKYEEAVGAFKQAIRLDPNNASALFNLGVEYASNSKLDEARAILPVLRPKDPERAKKLENAIAGAIEAGVMIDKAREAAHALKRKEYLDQARKYRDAQDYLKAIEAAKKSISYVPSVDAYVELGLCYLELKQAANAVQAFQEGIHLEPSDPVLHFDLAYAYLDLGEFEKAKVSAKESLRLKGDDVDAINLLGVAHGRLKEYAEAIPLFEKAVCLQPTNGLYQYSLGKTYFLMGRKADAQTVYRKLLVLDKAQAQKLYEVMGISSQSLAAKMHFPQQRTIKFSFNVPEGWTTRADDPNKTLVVRAPGEEAAMMILTVIDDPKEQSSLQDVARNALMVAKAKPYTIEKDTSLSGMPGKTFYSTMNLGEVYFNLRMSIFKIGTTYLSATEVTRVGKTQEQHQQLASLGIVINGAK